MCLKPRYSWMTARYSVSNYLFRSNRRWKEASRVIAIVLDDPSNRSYSLNGSATMYHPSSRREGSLLRAYGCWQTHVPATRGTIGTSVPLTWVPMYTAGKVAGGVRRLHSLYGALGSSAPTILMPRMGPSGTVQGTQVPCDPRLRESHLELSSSVSRSLCR